MTGRAAFLLSVLAVTAACSPSGSGADNVDDGRNASIELYRNELKAVTTIERDTRVDMLERRIVALETELGAIKVNPETLQLDLLASRLAIVEQRALAEPAPAAAPPRAKAPPADLRKAEADAQKALQRKRPQATATPQ